MLKPQIVLSYYLITTFSVSSSLSTMALTTYKLDAFTVLCKSRNFSHDNKKEDENTLKKVLDLKFIFLFHRFHVYMYIIGAKIKHYVEIETIKMR